MVELQVDKLKKLSPQDDSVLCLAKADFEGSKLLSTKYILN